MEFKVGDRVRANQEYQDSDNITGKLGTVLCESYANHISVEFDDKLRNGHQGNGNIKGKMGYCWQLKPNMLDLVEPPNTFMNCIGDKFKNRKAKVVQNGNVYKLVKTDGKVLYTYIPTKGISSIAGYSDKTEKMYIELFEQAIEEFNKEKE